MLGILLAFAATVGFATNIVCARVGLQYMRPSSGTIIASVVAFSLVMIPALTIYWSQVVALPASAFLWLALIGSLHFGVGRFLNLTTITITGAARQSAILASMPFFSSFFAITLGSETLTVSIILGTLSISAGLVLIVSRQILSQRNNEEGARRRRMQMGMLLGILTTAIYGFSVFLESKLVNEIAPPIVSSAFALMFGALFVTLIFHRSAARDIRSASKRGWLFMAFSGIGVAWGLSFLFLALSHSPVVVVGPAMNISPLITLTISHIFLQRIEKVTLPLIAGCLLIVAGAAGITVSAS